MKGMKWINLLTLALLIIGGLNGFGAAIGGHEMDVIANAIGDDGSVAARTIYALIGVSALWQLIPFFRAWRLGEADAEASRRAAAAQ